MSLYRFLDQERTPLYTGISCLVTVAVEAVILVAAGALPGAGFGAVGIVFLTGLLVVAAAIVNTFLGSLAYRRGEYWGGRIAASGIAVWLLTISGLIAVPRFRAEHEEGLRTWGATGSIVEVIVQEDGKLVLLGAGVVRLLPDGAQDTSFHRDYSFPKRGSLPGPLGNQWPNDGCAVSLPNGDLVLAAMGWVGRVLSDGRDGRSFSVGPPSNTSCWSLAVQGDGMVITGWAFGPGGSRLSRNLPDGGIDPNFRTDMMPSFQSGEIALQETGKIILAGWVRSPDRTVSLGQLDIGGCFTPLRRLNVDGSQDESFSFAQHCRPKGYGAPGPSAFALLRDGSMLFTANVNRDGGIYSEVIHLDSNGVEIRHSALRDALKDYVVSALVPTSHGRILVGGRSSSHYGVTGVDRLLDDGTHDPTFHAQDGFDYVKRIRLQGENILVLDGIGKLHRLNRDGDRDRTFRLPLLKVYSH